MIVAVVGSDGAGKSTLVRSAQEALTATGHAATRVDRWDIVGNPVYPATRFLVDDVPDLRACVAEMPNPPRFLFLMWSIGTALLGRPADDERAVTLLDGYWMKHAASEIVYGLDPAWVEAVVRGLPAADLVVHLRLDPEAAWRRKVGRDVVPYECGMDETCSEESFLRHQRRLAAILDAWSERFGWVTVDADADPGAVVAAVLAAVREHGRALATVGQTL